MVDVKDCRATAPPFMDAKRGTSCGEGRHAPIVLLNQRRAVLSRYGVSRTVAMPLVPVCGLAATLDVQTPARPERECPALPNRAPSSHVFRYLTVWFLRSRLRRCFRLCSFHLALQLGLLLRCQHFV